MHTLKLIKNTKNFNTISSMDFQSTATNYLNSVVVTGTSAANWPLMMASLSMAAVC